MPRKSSRRDDGYSVYRRKDGRWVAAVVAGVNSQGKVVRRYAYCHSRQEAVEAALKMRREIDETGAATSGKDVTVSALLEDWLESIVKPNRAPKTYRFYEANIRLHLNPEFGKKRLRQLDARDLQSLLNRLAREGKTTSTVRGVQATLRAALNYAKRNGSVVRNVGELVTVARQEQVERLYLSVEEAGKLLKACEGRAVGDLVAFTLIAGTRIGESTGITWGCVDLDEGFVYVNKQLQREEGKLGLRPLKSRTSRRTIPLTSQLRRAIEGGYSGRATSAREPDDSVFVNSDGRPWDQRNANGHLKEACIAAGIKVISFHSLRHTAATIAMVSGAGVHQVKGLLGHSQISLTANLYGHHVDEGQSAALRAIERALGDHRD